jgi:hypothetical protein
MTRIGQGKDSDAACKGISTDTMGEKLCRQERKGQRRLHLASSIPPHAHTWCREESDNKSSFSTASKSGARLDRPSR